MTTIRYNFHYHMIFLLVPIKLLSHRSRSFSTTRVCFSGGKPVGHARTILNMHNKILFNPNHLYMDHIYDGSV